ncbi:MAG TPA: hypothetical protein VNI84_15930 [Pyrinomonadaceae bacterium]|nr:hypothetical protein [Pyrinomonadaceae bacterium]
MSRSKPTELKNPAIRFFKWSGSEGTLNYYDKETKENVPVAVPFTFLVLDKLITIVGFDDEAQSGIWSNEILNTKTQTLTVRSKNGIKKEGLYEAVKTVTGAKFAQSLYIAFFDDEKTLQIGNIKLSGCAVSSWIEFGKGRDVYQGAIQISDKEEGKKGATKFFSPVFNQIDVVKQSTNDAALQLDAQLQTYLTAYFAQPGHEPVAVDNESYIEQRNRELEEYEPEQAAASANGNPHGSTYGDHVQPMDDDDIPFALLFAFIGLSFALAMICGVQVMA